MSETAVASIQNVQDSYAVVKGNKDREKAARFKRLATARTNKALKAILLIGNLTGANYENTVEQVSKINEALLKGIDEVNLKLSRKAEKEISSFSL